MTEYSYDGTAARDELDMIRLKIAGDLTKLQSNVQERLATIRKAEEQPLETVVEKYLPARLCHILSTPAIRKMKRWMF